MNKNAISIRRGLIATALMLAPVFTLTDNVEARCLGGAGLYVTSTFAREQNSAGTCDSDNHYFGGIYDTATDQHCVAAAQYINGVWDYYSFSTCFASGAPYDFTDLNSYTLMYVRWSDGGKYTPQVENSTF